MEYGLLHHRSTWSIDRLTLSDVEEILRTARSLKLAARAGREACPLRGKVIAFLSEAEPDVGRGSLHRAAAALGARVVHVHPDGSGNGLAGHEAAIRLLGRLYDAIECVDMPPELVERIERDTGVPVLNGLSKEDHPTAAIAEILEIQEHAGSRLAGLEVAFTGSAETTRGRALLHLAELLGLTLKYSDNERTEFRIDASDTQNWRCSFAGIVVGQDESVENRRYVLEALLLMAMS